MASSKPYGGVDNYVHNSFCYLIPPKHEDLPQTIAQKWIQLISRNAEQTDSTSCQVMARIQSFVFPIFHGLAIIQLGCVLIADVILVATNYVRYQYQVENNISSLESISLKNDVKELISHVVAIIPTVLGWAPAVILAPGIFYHEHLGPRPTAEEKKTVDTLVSDLGNTIETLKREIIAKENSAFLKAHTPITESLFNEDHTPKQLYQGIQLRRITHTNEEYVSKTRNNKGVASEYRQESWGVPGGYFDPSKTAYTPVPIDNVDLYTTPHQSNILEVEIDCDLFDNDDLKAFLNKKHQFNRLVLINPKLDKLDNLEGLRQIHTLILKPKKDENTTFSSNQLATFAGWYPNIKCYNLSACTFDKMDTGFNDTHIVFFPKHLDKSLSFEGDSNLEAQHNRFNEELFNLVKAYAPDNSDEFETEIKKILNLPAAKFCTKFRAFSSTQLRTADAAILLKHLMEKCPHMEILDFQNCYMLESEIFLTLADCKIKHLYLQGCENIYFRRARQLEKGNKDSKLPEEEIFEMETIKHPIKKEMVIVREKKPDHIITLNRPGLRIVERRYILDMHSVTYGLKHLVSNGAERIRLEGVLVGSKTQLKKGAQENERLKIVNLENCVYQAIYLSVYPIIAYWANPKSFARDIKLYFGEDKSFNGIPQVKTS